ncbi:hypothetical protein V2J09_002364 [Rumex salicifolius]
MGMMKVKLTTKDYWPSCSHSPQTLSFRHSDAAAPDRVFKTLNSVYFDSDSDSESDKDIENDDIESIVRGAHSETRLFFEPSTGKAISVPVEEEETEEVGPEPFKESVVMAMESEDPYVDFKRSMQEMMEAHALLKDWASLEELLAWYLRVNAKHNHAYIVAAFVDLLVKFSSSSSSSSTSDGVNSSLNINISSCSTSRSSSSCACVHCRRDHHHQHLVLARKSKSTTSFSSAASSFSSDEAGEQR